MLILFDIDGTLITTGGAGIRAMVRAGRDLHSPDFTADGIEFAGRLDPLILREMLEKNRVPVSDRSMADMRAAYVNHLPAELAAATAKRSLPGVAELVMELRRAQTPTLGLLTGNFAESGSLKLRTCGIEPDHFPIQAWGDESPHTPPARTHLPPVAMSKFLLSRGRELRGEEVTIIGDTPHDVACARAHGCRSLAVATGRTSMDDLAAAGATRVVRDLSEFKSIADWLLSV
jgi:phosphoglycolate phosphatase